MFYLVFFSVVLEEYMEDWKVGEFDIWVCCIKESSYYLLILYKVWILYKVKI